MAGWSGSWRIGTARKKHVWRARIILATAAGCGTAEIMRRAEVSKPCVWRWQERFMRETLWRIQQALENAGIEFGQDGRTVRQRRQS